VDPVADGFGFTPGSVGTALGEADPVPPDPGAAGMDVAVAPGGAELLGFGPLLEGPTPG
jgi:hypothetical protein